MSSAVRPHWLPPGGNRNIEARFWRARAEALNEKLSELRDRLLVLANVLPPEWAKFLTADLGDIQGEMPLELFGDWEVDGALVESHVAEELEKAWLRLGVMRRP